MTRIVLTRDVAAPPPEVFVFFVPQRMPYWYGAEMQCCFEVQDGAADFSVGLKVRISGTIGSRQVSHTAVVTAYQYQRLLEWRFQDSFGVRGRERWELGSQNEPGRSRTVITFTDEYTMPGLLGGAVNWLFTRHAIARRNREYLDRLARLAERRP